MPLIPGDVVYERYHIEDLLAQGGMSAVYQAWDSRLGVPCALKEMVPYPGMDEKALSQLRDQFLQEAQVLAELRHPHLPRVTDHFEFDGGVYLVMDYVDGQRLDEIIEREGAIPVDTLLVWARDLFDALHHCHQQGVLHRDVKPQNVIITPEGTAMLVDFGLAKLLDIEDRKTRTVMRGLGTPEYAPPEQYDAEPGSTDERSDIYAMGATLYHALTGTPPPTATQRIVDPNLLKPVRYYINDVSPNINDTILKSLALQPNQRFRTVSDMAEILLGSSIDKPTSEPLGNGTRPMRNPLATIALSGLRRVSRPRLWAGVGGGALILIILFIVLQRDSGPTAAALVTPTASHTVAPPTATATLTPQPTASPTATATATATYTPSPTPSETPTPVHTLAPTSTPTATTTPTTTTEPTETAIGCIYDVELVEVRDAFALPRYWFPYSPLRFELVLRNNGTCAWPQDTRLALISEDTPDWPKYWDVGLVEVDEIRTIEISEVRAPLTPGIYALAWQLELSGGQSIDSPIVHNLGVGTNTPTPTQPTSTVTPTRTPRPPANTPTPTPTPTTTPTPTNTPTITPTPTRTPRITVSP